MRRELLINVSRLLLRKYARRGITERFTIRDLAHCESNNDSAVFLSTPARLAEKRTGREIVSTIGLLTLKDSNVNHDQITCDGKFRISENGAHAKSIVPASACTISNPFPSSPWLYPAAIHQQTCNEPVEDRGILDMIQAEEKDRSLMVAGVIDGHSGWQVSEYVSKFITNRLRAKLSTTSAPSDDEVVTSIKSAFESLDQEMLNNISKATEMGFSSCAKPGATTGLVLVNDKRIYATNLGDSISVLSRRGKAIPLGEAHNAKELREQKMLMSQHPNEVDVFVRHKPSTLRKREAAAEKEAASPERGTRVCLARFLKGSCDIMWGKLFGGNSELDETNPLNWPCYTKNRLQLTRAFGDYYLKSKLFQFDFEGDKLLLADPVTYPYLTATPEVKVVARDKSKDEFVLVASDGLWDFYKPQEAVDFINKHLKQNKTPGTVLELLKQETLQRAAKLSGKTNSVEDLFTLPPKERRQIYDDLTTCLIVFK